MKKTLCFILASLFVLLMFASCASSTNPADTTADTSPAAATSAADETTVPAETTYEAPAVIDTNKYVYTMLCNDNSLWMHIYFTDEEMESGNVMDDTLFRREAFIEQTYNCTVEHIIDSKADTTLGTAVYSGTDLCSVAFLTGIQSMSLAQKGYLTDLKKVDGFKLESPWWDQRMQEEYLIGNRLFTITGDIDIRDDLRTMTVIYNKEMYNDYNFNTTYGTPYKMVTEGNWTYDKLMEMIKGVTQDPNDVEGVWGMYSENSAPYYFFLGSGNKTVYNRNGELIINLDDENVLNTLEKTAQMALNTDILIVNSSKVTLPSETWAFARNQFKAGKVLFRSTTLSAVNDNVDMVQDYGILPIPNLGGNTEYYCYVSGSHVTPVTIPSNVKGEALEKTVAITEAYAYYSLFSPSEQPSLHDAFYSLLGDGRLCRTYDDTKMLDIVFASKTYDIDQAASITGFESSFNSAVSSKSITSIASMLATSKRTAANKLKNILKVINEKNP